MSQIKKLDPGLYVVATPIGNLQDMTPRAISVLKSVELIAAEDTRHSAHLLQVFGIDNTVISYHDFSGVKRLQELVDRLISGQAIALISDAGTPAISDPGFELVFLARQQGLPVFPIPGASAMLAAISVAGLPCDNFIFEGFLPAKTNARKKQLQALCNETRSIVFFESPHRIIPCLEDINEVVGSHRQLYIGRELTKRFETSFLDTIENCIKWIKQDDNQQKGEFVLVLEGRPKESRQDEVMSNGLSVLNHLLSELSLNSAVKLAAKISGAPKNKLYEAALTARSEVE